jgi:curved DNA-binding protein CbpA
MLRRTSEMRAAHAARPSPACGSRSGRSRIMVDLYAVLGVSRDADLPTIRRAFRRKVRATHPDGGGSVEAFNELKIAYDVLSDPIRRARYDESGEFGAPDLDPHGKRVVEILSVGLDLALLKLSRTPHVRKDSDIIRQTAAALAEKRQEWVTQKGHFIKGLDDAHRLKDRFRVAKGENLMEVVVANRISALERQIAFLTANVELIDEALEILHNTRFDSPLELTDESDSAPELTDDQKRIFSWLDRSNLVWFK